MALFRQEVLQEKRLRFAGDVALTGVNASWTIVGLLTTLTAILVLTVTMGHYSRTERVVGQIVPKGALARIIPSRPGVVVQVDVRDGDWVTAGQPLATVQVEQASTGRSSPTAADLASIDQQQQFIALQISLARRAGNLDRLKISSSLRQLNQDITSLSEQVSNQEGIVESSKKTFEPLASIMQRGFISKAQYEQRRKEYFNSKIQLSQLKSQLADMEAQYRQAMISLTDAPVQTQIKTSDLLASQAAITQRRIDVESAGSYVLVAPVAGEVSALQIGRGSSVSSGFPAMYIVGHGSGMIAQVYIPSRAIGFAKPGQRVRLMYDAFPFERYGAYGGRLLEISPTLLSPREIDTPVDLKEPVYRATVILDRQSVVAFGRALTLQPGMTLTANLILERRTFIDWLLAPLNAVKARS